MRPQQNRLNLTSLASIVEIVRDLRNEGYNVVLVSSGAVGVGCQRLGLVNRPSELAKKQALAAVGQVHLMRYYDDLFSAVGLVRLLKNCLIWFFFLNFVIDHRIDHSLHAPLTQ